MTNTHTRNEHIFLYLGGWINDLPNLADATLKVISVCPEYFEHEPVNISNTPGLVVRRRGEYGGPFRPSEYNVGHFFIQFMHADVRCGSLA